MQDANDGARKIVRPFIGFLTAACLAAFASEARATDKVRCDLSFDVTLDKAFGTLPKAMTLPGKIVFSVDKTWQHDDETVSYFANGEMRVGTADTGLVEAEIRVVHVVRSPNVGDYVSIDSWKANGNLGGQTRYEDPMLATFYAGIGTLTSFDIPKTMKDWDQLAPRRIWLVHSPDAMSVLSGEIVSLSGGCG